MALSTIRIGNGERENEKYNPRRRKDGLDARGVIGGKMRIFIMISQAEHDKG
ncbi:MAG: hypothetical protein KF716_02390 [Anaerolineae bacterium]|nr:hypothetical protein [Anaerolineae bacterium]